MPAQFVVLEGRFGEDRSGDWCDHGVIDGRVAGRLRGVGEQDDVDRHSRDVEVPCHDQSVTAVVSPAASDDDGAIHAERKQQFRHRAPGVFHEDDTGNGELVHRPAIQPASLLCASGA